LRLCGDAAPAKPTTDAAAGEADAERRAPPPRCSEEDSDPPLRALLPSDALP
jgi:hypothetical protein